MGVRGGKVAQLRLLHPGPEREINIFVHGYRAVGSAAQLEQLSNQILAAQPRGRVYLLFWKSGRWKVPLTAVTVAGEIVGGVVRVAKFDRRIAAALAAIDVASFMIDFGAKLHRANYVGQHLKRQIAHIPKVRDVPINLIGHSMGARVIHEALSTLHWGDYKIRDVILLAGCTDARPSPEYASWDDCVGAIGGNLCNVYSRADHTLHGARLALEAPIGRREIEARSSRVKNVKLSGFGHTDHWPNLEMVLRKAWPGFRQSKTDILAERLQRAVACPYCQSKWSVTDGVWFCTPSSGGCGLDFSVEDGAIYYEDNVVPCGSCGFEWEFDAIEAGATYQCPECDEELWGPDWVLK